jgi:hypothetical protein
MLPDFLVPETTIREAGAGPVLELSTETAVPILATLGITRITEQESLDMSIWASADGSDWGSRPLISFPQKFYCGTYQITIDLSDRPDVKFLRAKWQVNRWGKGDPKPLFTVYLFLQEARRAVLAMGA